MDRLARLAIPDDRGLALVGDADRREVGGRCIRGGEGAVDALARALPDLARIVLDPAGPRIDLLVLTLIDRGDPPVAVNEDEATTRGSLVDRPDIGGHLAPLARAHARSPAPGSDRRNLALVREEDLERELLAVGERLYSASARPSRGSRAWLDDRAMEHASRDRELRAALFRF